MSEILKMESAALSAHKSRDESSESEIVLGRRQIAGLSFMAIVVVVVFSAGSYLVGKVTSPPDVSPMVAVVPTPPAPPIVAPAPSAPAPVAPVIEATIATEAALKPSNAPLFAEPEAGAIYLQLGALDRGMAVILTEGLRTHGMQAFVAPGPRETVFRVLVGPLRDEPTFRRNKALIDAMGLTNFARRYQKN